MYVGTSSSLLGFFGRLNALSGLASVAYRFNVHCQWECYIISSQSKRNGTHRRCGCTYQPNDEGAAEG